MQGHCTPLLDEEWRPVVGYEGWYEVSNLGRVRRVKAGPRTYVGRVLKPQRLSGKPGYWGVRLWRNTGRGESKRVHLLVAAAFLDPQPSPLHEINHRDGDSWNNVATNLEWLLHEDNVRHAFQNGLVGDRRGTRNANARLTEADILAIRQSDETEYVTATRYGVSVSTIGRIRRLEGWQDIHAFRSPDTGQRRGARHPRTHLTEDDVRTIRAYPSAVTHLHIASVYGVSDETIRAIRLRKSWRHVE